MSNNIKDVRYKPRQGIGWSMAAMLRDVFVVVVGRTCPRFMFASHVDREKKVASVSSSILACDSVPIVMVLHLAAVQATGSPL